MAAQIIQDTGKDAGEFVKVFGVTYIMELINSKISGAIEDAIAEVMPAAAGGGDDGGDDGEEKKIEDKEDAPDAIAAGVLLAGYKSAWGPDRIYHKYFDFACFAIRPENSVISKFTTTHLTMIQFAKKMKKTLPAANVPFPGKKRWGKKDAAYYRSRFTGMQEYFSTMLGKQDVCTHDDWLIFFGLKFDAAAADRRELFYAALEAQCEKDNINWSSAYRRAQYLGLDTQEVEMLKVVAIEKVGKTAYPKVRDAAHASAPGFLPASFKHRFVSKAEGALASTIGTTVQTGWGAAEGAVNKVADGLSEAMDKAVDPLKEMFTKIMTPVKELIDSKIKKPESKEEPLDEKLQGIGPRRFPPVAAALDAVKSGKAADACSALMSAVCDLNYTHRYTPYIQYNCGDPDILEWFPPIENIAEKHQRLTVALIDVTYVLGRGMCRAFMPLCEYVDKAAESFDEKTHEDEVKKAVLAGGQKLALDYFSLPYNTWRATWWCGQRITSSVLSFCRETVNRQADVLGSVATNWKPTSKDDLKETFATALEEALTAFLNDRVWTIVQLIRDSAARMIANIFLSVVGDAIEKIGGVLDDLCAKLPPPLNDLKPGDIVTGMITGFVEKIAMFAVLKWARKPECFLAGEGEPEPWDEALAAKFRVTPRIREDDEDPTKEEEEEKEEEDGDAGADKGADAGGDAPATEEAATEEAATEEAATEES